MAIKSKGHNRSANGSQTFRDSLVGYVVILAVVLVIGAIIAGGTYWSVIHDVSHDSYGKWVGFIIFTLGSIWWIIKESRSFWHNRVFGIALGSLFSVHVIGFSVLLWYVERLGMVWFLVICIVEVPIMMQVLGWARRQFGKSKTSKHRRVHAGTEAD